jgi:hypothetical protein
MRKYTLVPSFSESRGLRFLSMVAAVTVAAMVARAETQGDPKPYTLFMGADFSVGLEAKSYPVWDVSGNSWVIKVNGKQILVYSTKGEQVDLKISPGLKLTEISALITKLKSERSFSAGNDPYEKFTRQTNQAASDAFQSQSAINNAAALSTEASVQGQRYGSGPGGGGPIGNPNANGFTSASGPQRLANIAAYETASANVAAGASQGMAVGANTAIDMDGYDAMDVRFEVSAARPLDHPYVVLVGRYRERNGPPGAVRNWISAEALARIDSNSTKVRILRPGLPRGFEMKDLQVHLYNDGEEVATNVSSNRVELTRDDAFEYVKMDYVGSHRGATLPAVPAMGKLPADLPSRLAGGQFGQPYYVKVSKDGLASSAYLDEACSRQVNDPYVESMLKDIRFKPALDNGKPVDGVAKLKLGELPL